MECIELRKARDGQLNGNLGQPRRFSLQALPDKTVDLSFAIQSYRRGVQREAIPGELKESLLFHIKPIREPAQLHSVNDETLLVVDSQ